jgi:hypothetical protein
MRPNRFIVAPVDIEIRSVIQRQVLNLRRGISSQRNIRYI